MCVAESSAQGRNGTRNVVSPMDAPVDSSDCAVAPATAESSSSGPCGAGWRAAVANSAARRNKSHTGQANGCQPLVRVDDVRSYPWVRLGCTRDTKRCRFCLFAMCALGSARTSLAGVALDRSERVGGLYHPELIITLYSKFKMLAYLIKQSLIFAS